jgi:hypothetical protein
MVWLADSFYPAFLSLFPANPGDSSCFYPAFERRSYINCYPDGYASLSDGNLDSDCNGYADNTLTDDGRIIGLLYCHC